jgi:hypothetical protein
MLTKPCAVDILGVNDLENLIQRSRSDDAEAFDLKPKRAVLFRRISIDLLQKWAAGPTGGNLFPALWTLFNFYWPSVVLSPPERKGGPDRRTSSMLH